MHAICPDLHAEHAALDTLLVCYLGVGVWRCDANRLAAS
jgi:hypothetical protein